MMTYLTRPGCAFHRKEVRLIRSNAIFLGFRHNVSCQTGKVKLLEGCTANLTLNPAICSAILFVRLFIIYDHSSFFILHSSHIRYQTYIEVGRHIGRFGKSLINLLQSVEKGRSLWHAGYIKTSDSLSIILKHGL